MILKNAKHEKFAQGLAKGLTADQAYQEAGYKADRGNAARLTANDSIRARVDEIKGKGAERAEISVERVLTELGRIGLSDLRDAFDERGRLLPPSEWSDAFAASVASIEVVTKALPGEANEEQEPQGHGGSLKRNRNPRVEYVHKIKVWDKNSALEKLAKHFGLLVERTENINTNYNISDEPMTEDEWEKSHTER